MRRTTAALTLLALAAPAFAADPAGDIHAANKRLGRGINFGNALEAPNEGEWGLRLKAEYFKAIKDAGFDSVRLPVRWSAHAEAEPPYALDPTFAARVDWAIDQALKNDLNIVVNVHHYAGMDEDPDKNLPRLVGLWGQIAERYKDRPAGVYFELLNEPHDKLTAEKWNAAVPKVLAAVRKSNPTRPVIVGPVQWNSIGALPKLELPYDRNLIVTVHSYDPFEFTHQGAAWAKGSEKWLGRKWAGTEAERAAITKRFQQAADWGKKHDRPIYLGEFGAFEKADTESRARWTAFVAREAERLGWSWAYWEFGSGFGAYDPKTDKWREPIKDALVGGAEKAAPAKPVSFRLTFDKAALDEPFTGRVFVLISKTEPKTLPRGVSWFSPEPGLAQDVVDWKPGRPLTLGASSFAFPTPLKDLKPGKYYAVAVMDRDLGGISFAASPGNVYSKPIPFEAGPHQPEAVELTLDKVYEPPPFKETDNVKLAEVESKLLTKFHGRPTKLRAGVILPPSFAKEPDKKYPVVYEITGFGGDHTFAARKPWDVAGTEMIWVVLDANCRLGHHVFADSANNGPVGTALVTELIPYIEKTYRGIGQPGARFVTGHSSGGWSSLWLQVAYPDFFGGCWSTSPDPVDFRDFQKINLYDPKSNMFTDADGKPRPLSRPVGGRVLEYRKFSDMDVFTARGGQLFSFEAVFSPRGRERKPMHLWNRETGRIDPGVAEAWRKYDIRLKLEREWPEIGSKLTGKLHVYMGEQDTFLLEGAVKLLKESLEKLGSDAVVELFPGKTHALVDAKLRKRMNEEMATAFKNWRKAQADENPKPE